MFWSHQSCTRPRKSDGRSFSWCSILAANIDVLRGPRAEIFVREVDALFVLEAGVRCVAVGEALSADCTEVIAEDGRKQYPGRLLVHSYEISFLPFSVSFSVRGKLWRCVR
jgi:hypothetical protein